MLYDVILRIDYEYDNPPAGGHHHLRLMPLNIDGEQRLLTGLLTITPKPNERYDRRDFFDNAVCQVSYHHAHPEISFKVQARIERLERRPVLNITPTLEKLQQDIANYRSLSAHSPHHFISESTNIHMNDAMTDYAKSHIQGQMNTYDIVQSIGRALFRDMKFDPKATTVETSAQEAFQQRSGVCQDFSHIMITCLRAIGIPSGYVSGFLRTKPPEGQTERLEGADAMHAWVRAWCGSEMGWIEYDPTNEMFVGTDHVVVAYGRDYNDVSPVRGVLKMAGDQSSKQAVDVIPIEG
jgi:transglutaminase-like putative cysteine protease